jgi:hypothetical protein
MKLLNRHIRVAFPTNAMTRALGKRPTARLLNN